MKAQEADYCVIIMSGDFVQRGAPSLVDKFTRTKMALSCGIDLVLELPVYYSLSSAEYFAGGAVSILDKLGCIDYLCFGSECGDIAALTEIANILNYEPNSFKLVLEKELKAGESFASARQKALFACLEKDNSEKELSSLLSSPNNILAIEYIRALQRLGSRIKPYTIKRLGEDYHSDEINAMSSASAIRNALLSPTTSFSSVEPSIPSPCLKLLRDYDSSFAENNKLSELLYYKLLSEKSRGYTKYLDISEDFSNKTVSRLDEFSSFDEFCALLKSKDLAYGFR